MTDRDSDGSAKNMPGASLGPSSSDAQIDSGEIGTIAVLIGLALMMQVSINIMIPALPAISSELGATPMWEKLTLTAFMIGYGVSPLMIGPLSDRYGRRPVLLCGLAVFVAASIGCTLAPSIESLVWARFLQGVGGGSGLILNRAIARDLYSGIKLSRVSAYLSAGQGIGPMLAPLVGAALQEQFGWRSTFAFTAIFGASLMLGYAVVIAESNTHRIERLDFTALRHGYREVLGARPFLRAAFTTSFSFAVWYTFFAGAPTLFITHYGMSPSQFGGFVSLLVFGFVGAGILVGRKVVAWGEERFVAAGITLASVGIAGSGIWALTGTEEVLLLAIPMTIYSIGGGILLPLLSASAIRPYGHIAGTASAAFSIVFMGTSAAGTVMAGLVEGISASAFFAVMFVFQCLSVCVYLMMAKRS
jgi:DHA1 family bicyclomycin/chloramphenicol resistance-like MFS transporter